MEENLCQCQCKKRLLKLERRIKQLEEELYEKDAVINSLKTKNRQSASDLLEVQVQQLQSLLCEKDSSVAEVELELRQALDSGNREKKQVLTHLHQLQGERNKLARQPKEKVRERFTLYREDSEEILGAVAREYQDYSRDELCDELKSLTAATDRLRSYIDRVLAFTLETKPSLIDGLPRMQLGMGLKVELFSMASFTELLEELHEKEESYHSLQDYISLLLQRLKEQAPQLLTSSRWQDLQTASGGELMGSLRRTTTTTTTVKYEPNNKTRRHFTSSKEDLR